MKILRVQRSALDAIFAVPARCVIIVLIQKGGPARTVLSLLVAIIEWKLAGDGEDLGLQLCTGSSGRPGPGTKRTGPKSARDR